MDPVLRTNPFLGGGLGFGPARIENWPDTGKPTKLGPCPKCGVKGMLLFFTTTAKAYKTRCIKCGATHVVHEKGIDWRAFQRRGGAHIAAGPTKNEGSRSEYIDATKRVNTIRRRRELGDAYWRNPD